jgi:hypothetical protein
VDTHRSLSTNRSYHHLAVRDCGDTGRVVNARGLIRIRGDWILQQKFILEKDTATSEYMAHTVGNHGFWQSMVGMAA